MPTQNRRVATYLPPELDNRFKAFIAERNLKGDSQALIVVLSEFLGVGLPVTHSVDYSSLVKLEQFNELSEKVSKLSDRIDKELSDVIDKGSSPGMSLRVLLERLEKLEKHFEALEVVGTDEKLTLTTNELAKRLNMPSSSLSHWKSDNPKRGKSPDELLKATRERDPDKIGWILISELNRFKPERELPGSPLETYQSELPINS